MDTAGVQSGHHAPPLVVDLDGTLTPTDTLAEATVRLLKQKPWLLLHVLAWLVLGRAQFKERVAEHYRLSADAIPWREDFLRWLRAEREAGRTLILATAAHRSIAHAVAEHLGLFSSVLATDAGHNLKGANKLAAIRAQVGERFSYAGDSRADLSVWRGAETAVLVGASAQLARQAAGVTRVEAQFDNPGVGLRTWARALRVHQWIKNLLIFVPLFTAFAFLDLSASCRTLVAFLAFSLAASATYVFNDLWDLDSDRAHPRKRERPFASGAIAISKGIAVAGVLLVLAFGLAITLSPAMALVLLAYVVLTTFYSLVLKHYVIIDVLMLALLYTVRVMAGSVATGIVVSSWLLAFSVFTFFGLALIKRCAELVSMGRSGKSGAKGRDYQVGDLVVLWPLGVAASLCAVVVFGLYIGSAEAESQYRNTAPLWLAGVGLLYWVARLWVKTARGEMHDDPIVFAIRDFGSRVTIALMLVLVVLGHFFA